MAGGSLEADGVPQFIATLDRRGELVGYVRAEDLIPRDDYEDRPGEAEDPLDSKNWEVVYGEDLKTVVGHMIPNYGFLKQGDPVPSLDELEPVVIYEGERPAAEKIAD